MNFILFQFLIGTLKTVSAKPYFSSGFMFQFLIGTLKTLFPISELETGKLVSIPHRYAKNSCEGNRL